MEDKKKSMNIILAVVIVLVVAGILIFISIRNKVNMPKNDLSATPNTNEVKEEVNTNENAKVASPQMAKVGDTVAMNYTGRLKDGTVFDSNVDPKFNHVQPFIFTLGAGQVIKGWDKGIVGMKVGEKKTLVISPEDGYGASGAGGVIPPNATLTFDVELLAIKK